MSILSEPADVAILGRGPGECVPALRAAQRAASSALAAKEGLGGTCRNKETHSTTEKHSDDAEEDHHQGQQPQPTRPEREPIIPV
jgi:hypothetical protein